jgi:hypothetical protein
MLTVHILATLIAGASISVPINFTAGPAVPATSTLIASPDVVAGDGAASSSLVITARDAQGNPARGVSIVLSASGGNTTFGAASGTTLSDGSYSTTVISTQMQVETITARIASSFDETVSITFTGSPNATTSTLAVDSNRQTVGPSNVILASLTLRDAASNPLAGVTPAWDASNNDSSAQQTLITSSGATSASGVATATYTTNLAQSENVVVEADGLELYQPVQFLAGSANVMTSYMYTVPRSQLANNSNTITASIVLRDAYLNGIPNQTAAFSASGTSTTVVSAGQTDSTGMAQASYKTSTAQEQNALATVAGLFFTRPITFTGIPARCLLAVSPNNQVADGQSRLSLTATVTDGNNQAVPNILVHFSSTGAAQTFTPGKVLTVGSGEATSSLSSLYAGLNTVLAQAGNVQCTGQGNFSMRNPYCASNPNFISVSYTAGNSPSGLRSADFNGDGEPDIALLNTDDNTLSIFLNAGGRSFQTSNNYATEYAIRSIVVDDFDGDGNQDIVLADSYSVNFYAGTGSGNLILGQTGNKDYAFSTPLNFASATSGDFNLDGQQDLAIAGFYDGNLYILLGTGTGMFQKSVVYPADGSPTSIASGDFNADGIQDLVLSSINANRADIFLGTGTGAFEPKINFTTGNAPYGVAVGDFDRDGRHDLATVNYNDNTLDIFLGTGTGTLQGRVSYPSGSGPLYTAVGDLNGDGKQDIIAANNLDNSISVFLGAGAGTFLPQVDFPTGSLPRLPAIRDFDGDGKQDIAVANRGDNNFEVLYSVCD